MIDHRIVCEEVIPGRLDIVRPELSSFDPSLTCGGLPLVRVMPTPIKIERSVYKLDRYPTDKDIVNAVHELLNKARRDFADKGDYADDFARQAIGGHLIRIDRRERLRWERVCGWYDTVGQVLEDYPTLDPCR